MSVFFYISGHGFGHAARQIEIVNALAAAAPPDLPIVIRTSAPAWLFERTVRAPITFLPAEVDTGVVQIDSLRLDEAATIARAAAFHRGLPERAAAEAALLRQHRARLVIADAPPLAAAAAAAAGVPAVVCANFTWDWIYGGYPGPLASAPDLIPAIQDAYRQAEGGWRLPMHGGFDAVAPVVDVPFVARHARADRSVDDVRRALRLPAGRRLALVSFGGYGVKDLPLDRLDCVPEWGVVIAGPAADVTTLPAGLIGLPEERIYAQNLRYEDLVRAVDVVVTKPGYGIISDCLANDTAMLFTSRGRFLEYDVLVAGIPRILRSRYLEMEALLAGRWRGALEALAASPAPPERPRTDGARVVAAMIAGRLNLDRRV